MGAPPAPPSAGLLPPRAAENRLPSAGAGGVAGRLTAGAASDNGSCAASSSSQLQSDAAALLQSIQFSGRHSGSTLCAAAAAAFEDAEFVKLCEQSMGAQLQRTKEGATTQSRMLELAGGWLAITPLASGACFGCVRTCAVNSSKGAFPAATPAATHATAPITPAGMVKLLRRCLREALAKTSTIVDQGARMEHEMQSNVG